VGREIGGSVPVAKSGQIVVSDSRLLVPSRDAAKLLSICERTLWTLTNSGEMPCVRVRRSVLYSVEDLRAWVQSRRQFGLRGSPNQSSGGNGHATLSEGR
jgi:excisionase family DNA binding protein